MLSIGTNLSSFTAQKSLNNSTKLLNQAIERMSTGFKINGAKDNAANFAIVENMTTQLSSLDVIEDNTAQGIDYVTTANQTLDLINDRFTRLRNLAVQAENKTYGDESLKAINLECEALVEEIKRMYVEAEYNGLKIFGSEYFETVPTSTTYAGPTPTTFATEDTTLQELGIDKSSFQIYNSDNELIESYDTEKSDTIQDIFGVLSTYGFTTSITDGVISLSTSNGRYVKGDLMTALGIDLEQTDFISSSAQNSNSALYYTTTMTASEATTLSDIGVLTSGSDTVVVKNKYGDNVASFNVSSTTTLGGLFNSLGNYNIQGEIDDGVITFSSANGNYLVSQGVIANLGISNVESSFGVTTGTSQTSAGVVTYEKVVSSGGSVTTTTQEQTSTVFVTSTISETTTTTISTTTTITVTTTQSATIQATQSTIALTVPFIAHKGFINDISVINTDTLASLSSSSAAAYSAGKLADGQYSISTEEDLVTLKNMIEAGLVSANDEFVFANDITVTDDEFKINNFVGILNGNGKKLTLDGWQDGGLISMNNGTIKNLYFENSYASFSTQGAAFVDVNNGTLQNCVVSTCIGGSAGGNDSEDDGIASNFVLDNIGRIDSCRVTNPCYDADDYCDYYNFVVNNSGEISNSCVEIDSYYIENTLTFEWGTDFVVNNTGTITNSYEFLSLEMMGTINEYFSNKSNDFNEANGLHNSVPTKFYSTDDLVSTLGINGNFGFTYTKSAGLEIEFNGTGITTYNITSTSGAVEFDTTGMTIGDFVNKLNGLISVKDSTQTTTCSYNSSNGNISLSTPVNITNFTNNRSTTSKIGDLAYSETNNNYSITISQTSTSETTSVTTTTTVETVQTETVLEEVTTVTVTVTSTATGSTTTTNVSITSATTFSELALSSRAYITVMNDTTQTIITVKTADTVGSLITKLNNAGVTTTLTNGELSLSPNNKKIYISGMSDSLKDIFKLENDFYSTSLGVEMTDSNIFIYDGETTIKQTTSLSDIGVTSGELVVKKDGQAHSTINVSESQTIEQLLTDLRNAGFTAKCTNGVFSIEADGDMELASSSTNSSNAISQFGLGGVQQTINSTFANKDSAEINKLSEIVNKYWRATSDISLKIGTGYDANSTIDVSSGFTIYNLDVFANIGKNMVNQVDYITELDNVLEAISLKQAQLGASENRLMSVLEEISIKYDNLVSSRSTLRDADIAEESSLYIQQQILQQASATLLSVANQTPQLALQML